MADYTQNEDYSAKDALATGDPEKLILGSDIDSELAEIQTALDSKYDSTDLATLAQAQAESSNTVLMTPLRVANWADANGGMAGDIQALSDPGADVVLGWDDSAGAAIGFTLGTGLSTSTTTLLVSLAATELTDYDANRWIDHSAVSITAGVGLTGGGTIAATRDLAIDWTELTEDTSPDPDNDYVATYDASATTHKKVLLTNVSGSALGDGTWTRATSVQSLSAATEATVIFNNEVADDLQRGTYSTTTGLYTAGSVDVRLLVTATVTIDALNVGATVELMIHNNSVEVARVKDRNDADASTAEISVTVTQVITVLATTAVRIRAETSSAEDVSIGDSWLSIVELG